MSDQEQNQLSNEGSGKNPLGILELLALLGSVAGSAATAVGQPVIFAAAPLSLSLVLNWANRRRLEQLNLQNSQAALTQMHLLSGQMQDLQSSLTGTAQPSFQGMADQGTQEKIAGLESALAQASSNLHSYSDRLAALEQVGLQFTDATPTGFGEGISQEQLRSEVNRLISPLQQQFEALAAYLEQGVPRNESLTELDGDTSAMDMLKLQMQVQYTDVQASLNHVTEQLQNIPSGDKLEAFASTLTNLSNTVQEYSQRLEALEANPQFSDEDIPTAFMVSHDQDQEKFNALLEPLKQQLAELEVQLQQASAAPVGVEPAELDAIRQELQSLTAQMQTPSPAANEGLEAQLQQVTSNIESSLTQLGAAVADIQQMIPDAIQAQLQQQPGLSGLQQQIQDLEFNVDMRLASFASELKEAAAQIGTASTTSMDDVSPVAIPESVSNSEVDAIDLNSLENLLLELDR